MSLLDKLLVEADRGVHSVVPSAPREKRKPIDVRELRARMRPRTLVKLRCWYRCGWTGKAPARDGLSRFGESMRCPRCRRVAAIEVLAFVSR